LRNARQSWMSPPILLLYSKMQGCAARPEPAWSIRQHILVREHILIVFLYSKTQGCAARHPQAACGRRKRACQRGPAHTTYTPWPSTQARHVSTHARSSAQKHAHARTRRRTHAHARSHTHMHACMVAWFSAVPHLVDLKEDCAVRNRPYNSHRCDERDERDELGP